MPLSNTGVNKIFQLSKGTRCTGWTLTSHLLLCDVQDALQGYLLEVQTVTLIKVRADRLPVTVHHHCTLAHLSESTDAWQSTRVKLHAAVCGGVERNAALTRSCTNCSLKLMKTIHEWGWWKMKIMVGKKDANMGNLWGLWWGPQPTIMKPWSLKSRPCSCWEKTKQNTKILMLTSPFTWFTFYILGIACVLLYCVFFGNTVNISSASKALLTLTLINDWCSDFLLYSKTTKKRIVLL